MNSQSQAQKNVIAITRSATRDQGQVARQRQRITEYAERAQIKIVDELDVRGRDICDALARLIRRKRDGSDFDSIIVSDLSRVTRDSRVGAAICFALASAGIELRIADEENAEMNNRRLQEKEHHRAG